jgi:hypothetical protein
VEDDPRRNDPRTVAFHETGHGVVAHWLGLKVVSIVIHDGVRPGGQFDGAPTDDPVLAGKVALGGPHAEKIYQDRNVGGHFPLYYMGDDDKAWAWKHAQAAHPGNNAVAGVSQDEWRTEVDALLRARWDDVITVALALEQSGSLTGEDIEGLLGD